jgi:hypothetical protein
LYEELPNERRDELARHDRTGHGQERQQGDVFDEDGSPIVARQAQTQGPFAFNTFTSVWTSFWALLS